MQMHKQPASQAASTMPGTMQQSVRLSVLDIHASTQVRVQPLEQCRSLLDWTDLPARAHTFVHCLGPQALGPLVV